MPKWRRLSGADLPRVLAGADSKKLREAVISRRHVISRMEAARA